MRGLIGTSPAMRKICVEIEKFAKNELPVFIAGETGTGKDVCACTIHDLSERAQEPFVALNCASLSEQFLESELFGHVKGAYTGAIQARDGAIKRAHGGTLFLDEICDLPLSLQAKLLRFTEDYLYKKLGSDTSLKADIRIICASNKDIKNQIKQGLFREDLYYRLCVGHVTMPPLCERGGDVIDIAHYYLNAQDHQKTLSNNVQEALLYYSWPGNVRELQNIVKLLAQTEESVIRIKHLPHDIRSKLMGKKKASGFLEGNIENRQLPYLPLRHTEKEAIKKALDLAGNNIPRAAVILDVAPSTLYRKIKLWE